MVMVNASPQSDKHKSVLKPRMLPVDFSVELEKGESALIGFVSRIPKDWKHTMVLCGDDKPWTYILPSMSHFHAAMREVENRGMQLNAPHPLLLKLLESNQPEGHPVNWATLGSALFRKNVMPHQKDAINKIVERMGGRAFVALPTGTGKTITALGTAAHYGGCLLIIAGAQEQWAEETGMWTEFQPAELINGSKGDSDAEVVVCTYASVRLREDVQTRKWTTVIIDETQLLGGDCKTNSFIVKVCEKAQCVLAVSADPMKGRPAELFNTLRCLFPKIFTNRRAYEKRYCDGKMGRFGYEARGAKFLYELESLVRKRSVTCDKKVVLTDLPPITIKDVRLEMTEEVKAEFTKLRQDHKDAMRLAEEAPEHMRKPLKSKADAISSHMFRYTGEVKMPQCTEWFLKMYAERPKTDKYLVFMNNKVCIDATCAALIEKDIPHIRIDGDVPKKKRHPLLKCMRDPDDMSTRVAVMTIETCGKSLNMACANVVCMFQLAFTPSDNDQAYARAWRKLATKPVEVFRLLADGTHDDALLRIHESKTKVVEQIFKKLKQSD